MEEQQWNELPISNYVNVNQPVTCGKCGWSGRIRDARIESVNPDFDPLAALACVEGWDFYCPTCGTLVGQQHHATRIS